MFFDIRLWRFIIVVGFAKSVSWKKNGDAYLFHIGTVKSESETAIKIIFLPFLLLIGFKKF